MAKNKMDWELILKLAGTVVAVVGALVSNGKDVRTALIESKEKKEKSSN